MVCRIGLIVALALGGCSSEIKTPRGQETSATDEDDSGGSAADKKDAALGDPLELAGFEWGPYSAVDESTSQGIAWETGYIGMRQRKGVNQTDLFDYRWYSSVVASGSDLLSELSGTGCSAMPSLSSLVAGDYVKDVQHDGAFADQVEEKQGVFRLGEKGENDFTYTALDDASAKIETSDDVTSIDSPDLPATSQVSFTGATASGLNVGTIMTTLNQNLDDRTTDLTINDKGDGETYDVVIVVFYPSSSADASPVKCVLAPGDSLDVPASEYQTWLPLKGFVALSAKTSLEDGVWSSRYRGEGVEDLEIP